MQMAYQQQTAANCNMFTIQPISTINETPPVPNPPALNSVLSQ